MADPTKKNPSVTLSIQSLSKIFAGKDKNVKALDDVSLEVREGDLFTLLGPSGCGKTTTLRCIAGFEKPTSGEIDFLGRDYTSIPPFRRNIGMVFQSYALFPHMSIFDNVAYGLKIRKTSPEEIKDRVNSMIDLVGLVDVQKRKPSELSGGQQQRIALARALVYDPQLLLLDEPLSNLDAKLRVYMREEIRRIQQQAKVTTIYVTHDQEEALAISDQIAVMHDGKVSQIGTPDEIYENPNSIPVADFIGHANFLQCCVISESNGSRVIAFPSDEKISLDFSSNEHHGLSNSEGVLFVRPERIEITPQSDTPNSLKGTVKHILYLGSLVRYFIEIFEQEVSQEVLVDQNRRVKGIQVGNKIAIIFDGKDVKIFSSDKK
ncbi:MAG: ABC transporter ATP-binding protein [Nitrospinaceae bacterium]|jgi:spermidine/putrescine ABC transporter ATP-binding subunit|nr:ABC transporter ATP-binding protein [Candidatus Manganitrophaceae bacterium]